MKRDVGFIGLGKMGKPMAKNVLRAGYPLTVYDVLDPGVEELCALGARRGASPRDVASRSSVVITMLPGAPEVEKVALGPDGLKDGLARGATYVDMSTVDPATSRRIGRAMAQNGIVMLDAPVSRGQEAATQGTLSIMVGGDRQAFEDCLDLLESMGSDVFHCGEPGMGAVFKVVNNLIVAVTACCASEALVLGVKAGANPDALLQVLKASSANSFVLEHFLAKKALRGDFTPSGSIDTVKKDLDLALKLGEEFRVPVPFGAASHMLYSLFQGRGFGNLDFTAILRQCEEAAGVEARLQH